jgi:type VI protein secretion system component Hcp
MPKGDSSDIMMRFLDQSGHSVVAEGRALLKSSEKENPLLIGFKNPYVFEIDTFSLTAGRKSDTPDQTGKRSDPRTAAHANRSVQTVPLGHKPPHAVLSGFPGDLQPTRFTRQIDASSPVLMQKCIDKEVFKRISLIKRRSTGGPAAGEVFLRLDFIEALLIDVSWSNDDEVKEECEFVCRRVCINYRPQLPDGTLGAAVPGFWSMVTNETTPPPLE